MLAWVYARCVLMEEMSAARAAECEGLASQLVDARAEGRLAANVEVCCTWIEASRWHEMSLNDQRL